MKRIFVIGFNKCATTSLHDFFSSNGVKSVHWDYGRLAQSFFDRMSRNEDPFLDYLDVVSFSDMNFVNNDTILEPYKHFEYIHSFYPDSYYILNTRNVFDWLASRKRHPNLLARYKSFFKYESDESVITHWLSEWYSHHYNCISYFGGNKKFMLFDFDKHSPQDLIDFLAVDFPGLDKRKLIHTHKTEDFA